MLNGTYWWYGFGLVLLVILCWRLVLPLVRPASRVTATVPAVTGTGVLAPTYRTTGAYEYERVGQKEHLVHPDSRRRCGGCLLGISKHPDAVRRMRGVGAGLTGSRFSSSGASVRAHRAQCESVGYGGGKHAPLRACRRDASALCRPAFHRVGQ